MSIKQLGGVFGRNPTFNDVTIEGQLTFDGDIDVSSDLKVDGDLNVTGITTLEGNTFIDSAGSVNMILTGGDGNSKNIYFRKATGPTQQALIQTIGDDLRFFTGPSEAARFNSLGNLAFPLGQGIDFSATSGTGTSELFDDYEEGTWTPTLVGSTSAGTATFVSGPTGIYTKIGNQVTVYFDWNISAHTGTGALRVNGLPFAKGAGVGVGTIMDGNYTYSAGRPRLVPYVVGSVLRFYGVGDGVGYLENALDTSHQINGSVTYTV